MLKNGRGAAAPPVIDRFLIIGSPQKKRQQEQRHQRRLGQDRLNTIFSSAAGQFEIFFFLLHLSLHRLIFFHPHSSPIFLAGAPVRYRPPKLLAIHHCPPPPTVLSTLPRKGSHPPPISFPPRGPSSSSLYAVSIVIAVVRHLILAPRGLSH
ncbi:hypothetical protein AWENTII_008665 [Aspergillus wentii]